MQEIFSENLLILGLILKRQYIFSMKLLMPMLKKKGIAQSVFMLTNTQQNILVVIAEIVTRTNFNRITPAHRKSSNIK